MCDREAVGGLQVVHVVIEVERFLRRILVGVVELDSEPEGAVLLHRGAHEQSPFKKRGEKMQIKIKTRISQLLDLVLFSEGELCGTLKKRRLVI